MNSNGNIGIARKQDYSALAAANGYAAHVAAAHAARSFPYHPSIGHSAGETMAALANTFGGLAMTAGNHTTRAHLKASASAPEYVFNPSTIHGPNHVAYAPGFGLTSATNHSSALTHPASFYSPHLAHYFQQGYHEYLASAENPAISHNWTPRVASGEMPTLITPRRDSLSSNEQDVPGTPYTAQVTSGVAVFDPSPNGGAFTHSTTPSPTSGLPISTQGATTKSAPPSVATIPLAIQLLIQKDPPIPRAIPAPSSPAKPLDRSLENKNGETNVYIRGLHPETTDSMLHQWGRRFGEIQSSKSIIDVKTNLCKGFGFIKYYNYTDAEQCIRGFHYLGYEISFARESFYAKLKKFSDENNTNLYVSNIPRSMNEHELSEFFKPHKVVSCRILRDQQGNGRGVGFARFESREACENVIKLFNNTSIKKSGSDEHAIQIRFSDTHEQKVLKQQTAAARQFRAAEFEYGVMQARSNGSLPSIRTSRSTSQAQPSSSS